MWLSRRVAASSSSAPNAPFLTLPTHLHTHTPPRTNDNHTHTTQTTTTKVVETIVELAQIMRDLSTLVVEQGTVLDRIDHNVAETAVKVEAGVKELGRAEATQKSGRMMLCIIALLVMIVVMTIVVVLRHSL